MKKVQLVLVSTISVVVGFLIGHAGDIYNERDLLRFNDHNHQISISLIGCDQQITLKAAERINQNIWAALKEQGKTKKAFLNGKPFIGYDRLQPVYTNCPEQHSEHNTTV